MIHSCRGKISGYVRIYVEGYSPERFLNMCIYHGIIFWGLSPAERGYEMNITLKDYRKLKPMVRKTHSRIKIKGKYGIPFVFAGIKKRKLFFAGILLCCILLKLYSMFIWDIHFEGNIRRTDEALAEFLKSTDVYPLMLKNNVDCPGIVKSIRKEYNDIVWVSASVDGTRLLIRIKENDDKMLNAQNIDEEIQKPADLIASADGIITSIITRSGVPQVHVGDSVKKGDLLVLGRIDVTDDTGQVTGYRYEKSDADIYADTELYYQDSIPLNYMNKKYTGKEKIQFYINFGSWIIKAGSLNNGYKSSDLYCEEYKIKTGENGFIPAAFGMKSVKEYIQENRKYNEQEVREILSRRFLGFCDDLEEKGVQIQENNVKIQLDESSASAAGTVFLNESIARETDTEILTVERKETDESVRTEN